jgi:hypothetical protein
MADNTEKETVAQREWREKHTPTITEPGDIPRWNESKGRVEYSNGETPGERLLRLSEEKCLASLARGFDLRSEVSEDARYFSGRIVTHLWIIFVLLPVVLGILFTILYAVVRP